MSTLKVTNIESPSGGGVNAKITDINGGQLSNRNLIINGAMQVAQKATQKTGVTTSGIYTVDRFGILLSSLGTWTLDQSTDAPNGFSNSFKATCTTADSSPAASDHAYFRHRIEAQNLQGLGFGSSAAQSTTISFYVKSNKTGNASFNVLQPDSSFKMVGYQYSISAANTWEYKTITIPGDTSGTINNDNGNGLQLEWWFNSGSDWNSGNHQATWTANVSANRNPSNLGVGGATSDNFSIAGVQLEVGGVATAFEHRSFGDELARCQRYFQLGDHAVGRTTSASNFELLYAFPVDMRTGPTAALETNTTGVAQLGRSAVAINSLNNHWYNSVQSGGIAGTSADTGMTTNIVAVGHQRGAISFSAEL
jgi:hypothetical protein|tara:strand:- start:1041 stop:2138 length:1098 start_codon:yes stop_codon:yes gene_type:complete